MEVKEEIDNELTVECVARYRYTAFTKKLTHSYPSNFYTELHTLNVKKNYLILLLSEIPPFRYEVEQSKEYSETMRNYYRYCVRFIVVLQLNDLSEICAVDSREFWRLSGFPFDNWFLKVKYFPTSKTLKIYCFHGNIYKYDIDLKEPSVILDRHRKNKTNATQKYMPLSKARHGVELPFRWDDSYIKISQEDEFEVNPGERTFYSFYFLYLFTNGAYYKLRREVDPLFFDFGNHDHEEYRERDHVLGAFNNYTYFLVVQNIEATCSCHQLVLYRFAGRMCAFAEGVSEDRIDQIETTNKKKLKPSNPLNDFLSSDMFDTHLLHYITSFTNESLVPFKLE